MRAALGAAGATPLPSPRASSRSPFLDVGQGDATLLQTPGRRRRAGGRRASGHGPRGEAARPRRAQRSTWSCSRTRRRTIRAGSPRCSSRSRCACCWTAGCPADGPDHRRIVSLARARGSAGAAPPARVSGSGSGPSCGCGCWRPPRADSAADTDPNLRATVMTASYGGRDVFLPADAESEVTASLALPDVDVMKVAHHGSEDPGLPALLLARLRPEVAVIEVGRAQPLRPSASDHACGAAGGAVRRCTARTGTATCRSAAAPRGTACRAPTGAVSALLRRRPAAHQRGAAGRQVTHVHRPGARAARGRRGRGGWMRRPRACRRPTATGRTRFPSRR